MTDILIRINGLLYMITDEGRFRRHWKGQIRTNDSRAHRHLKKGICPECHKEKDNLTVDHHPPLRETIDTSTRMICWDCHSRKNNFESIKVHKQVGSFIQNCGKGHNTYLREDLTIYCKECNKLLNKLIKKGINEYEELKWLNQNTTN